MRQPPNRKKGGNTVSKLDRDTSKKNVALSKAKQQRDMAAKGFARRQKEIEKDLAALKKIQSEIEREIKKRGKEVQLEARFLRQVMGKVKALKNFEKQLKADQKVYGEHVETPKTYITVASDARKLPKPGKIQTYGDMSVMLALLIVLLNRLAALKIKKDDP